MSGRNRFRGKLVYTGGIVSQRRAFQERIDPTNPATAPVGGGGAGGLAWDYSAPPAVAKDFERIWATNSQTPKTPRGLDIYLGNAIGAESITYSATGLPSGLSINSTTGLLTGTRNPVGYSNVTVTASDGSSSISKTVYIVQNSQQQYTSAGTYSFIVPNFIDEISAVCVGPGGQGYSSSPNAATNRGGGGGGLRWIKNMPVISGETLTVTIPAQPSRTWNSPTVAWTLSNGSPVTIKRGNDILLEGGAGSLQSGGGGTPTGTKPYGGIVGGGNGGGGQNPGGAGAGAGGYDGPGGGAVNPANQSSAPAGSGGGAGGGPNTWAGGGVGLLGRTNDGVHHVPSVRGAGGSGGGAGSNANPGPGLGGTYGGGGSRVPYTPSAAGIGRGAIGGCRIIWGGNRNYPSNNTGDF